MRAIAAALAFGLSIAHAEGVFPSPDGAHRVSVSRAGDVVLGSADEIVTLGRMPWGPRVPLNPDIPIGGRFERAEWSADGELVAVFGRCRGYSGVTEPPTPRCAGDFVRVLSPHSPGHALALAIRWSLIADEASVQTLSFDATGTRLAAIVLVDWSDCSWEGQQIFLVVWDLTDGSILRQRQIADGHPWMRREVAFDGAGVRVSVGLGARRHSRVFPASGAAGRSP